MTHRPFGAFSLACTAALSIGVAFGPQDVFAQDPAGSVTAEAPEAENVVEAQRLYKLGEARYELFDFTAAIQYWTEAYALVPAGDADTHRVRTVLVRNLSVAHLKAFEVDEDPVHLRTGKMLLERYIKELQTYYTDEGDSGAELIEAQSQLAEIEEKLAKIEEDKANEAAANAANNNANNNAGNNAGNNGGKSTDPVDTGPQVDDEGVRKGKLLIVTGGAVLGVVGVGAGLGLTLTGALMGGKAGDQAKNDDAFDRPATLDRGRLGNTLAYVGISVGAVGLITGIALIAVGSKKKREASTPRVSLVPSLSPRNAGGTLTLEF